MHRVIFRRRDIGANQAQQGRMETVFMRVTMGDDYNKRDIMEKVGGYGES